MYVCIYIYIYIYIFVCLNDTFCACKQHIEETCTSRVRNHEPDHVPEMSLF